MRGRWILAVVALALPAVALADPPRRGAVAVAGMKATTPEAQDLARRVRAPLAGRAGTELMSEAEEGTLFRSAKPKTGRSKANLQQAKKHLKDAEKSLGEFDLASAVKNIGKAKLALARWTGLRDAIELDRERMVLSVQIAHAQRDEKGLLSALREYAARFPSEPPPQGAWPPDVVERLRGIALEDTVLSIKATPRATVFVDGREIGTTPVRLGALPLGEHRVELEAPNHFRADAFVTTTTAQETAVDVVLVPNLSSRLRKSPPATPPAADLLKAIQELTASAPLDFIVLVGPTSAGRLLLRRVEISARGSGADTTIDTVESDTSDEGLRLAIAQLFEGTEGVAAAPGLTPDGGRGIPMWAWIGGGAGAIAIGAGVAMRMMSVSTFNEYDARLGALTQTEAFELRDRSSTQATGGTVLLGVGVAAIAGVISLVVLDGGP